MKTCTRCGAIMTARNANCFVCEFCGNTVQIEQKTPIAEQAPQQQPVIQREVVYIREENNVKEEKLGCWMWWLCFFIPIVGLIMFFVYNSNGEKKKAKSAITAAIISCVIGFVIGILGGL